MRLSSINSLLRLLGVVLVVAVGDAGEPTTLYFDSARRHPLR